MRKRFVYSFSGLLDNLKYTTNAAQLTNLGKTVVVDVNALTYAIYNAHHIFFGQLNADQNALLL